MYVSAGAQVGFSICKKVVGTKVNYKIPANVGVCPFEFAGVRVAGEEVSISAHQFVEHRSNLGRGHRGAATPDEGTIFARNFDVFWGPFQQN